jgi:hypothetical protein
MATNTLRLKLDDEGHAVLRDGRPVFLNGDRELAVDVPAIFERLAGEALAGAPILKDKRALPLPGEVYAAMFRDQFVFTEDGRLQRLGPDGQLRDSRTEFLRPESVDEALAELLTTHPRKEDFWSPTGWSPEGTPAPAEGSVRAAAADKPMSRSAFEALDHAGKMAFAKAGGRVVPDAPGATPPAPTPAQPSQHAGPTITRAAHEALPLRDRMTFFRDQRGQIVG